MFTFFSNRLSGIILFTIIALLYAQTALGHELPARAFNIEGGSVEIQGGILAGKQQQLFNVVTITKLFMVISNPNKTNIWIETEVQLPGSKEVSKFPTMIEAGKGTILRVSIDKIEWNTQYPFKISVFADEAKTKLIGTEATYFFFEDKDKAGFEQSQAKQNPGELAILNGFKELPEANYTAEVKGTNANSELQQDIAWSLFKEESKSHRDCEHHVTKTEVYEVASKSVIIGKMNTEVQQLSNKLLAKGDITVEKWWVESCEATTSYEVLMTKSPQGGTDIMVEKLNEGTVKK
jgi:hypothetical protein